MIYYTVLNRLIILYISLRFEICLGLTIPTVLLIKAINLFVTFVDFNYFQARLIACGKIIDFLSGSSHFSTVYSTFLNK